MSEDHEQHIREFLAVLESDPELEARWIRGATPEQIREHIKAHAAVKEESDDE